MKPRQKIGAVETTAPGSRGGIWLKTKHVIIIGRTLSQRRRKEIFRLLLQKFAAMIEKTVNGHQPRPATMWRATVGSRLRCQGLIVVRQNQNESTTFPKKWSHN